MAVERLMGSPNPRQLLFVALFACCLVITVYHVAEKQSQGQQLYSYFFAAHAPPFHPRLRSSGDGGGEEREKARENSHQFFPNSYWADTDIRMDRLYSSGDGEEIDFVNPPTKVGWELGFEVAYNRSLEGEPLPLLEVFLLPHSHNDIGYSSSTFTERYLQFTGHILSATHKYLEKTPDVTFEWAEMALLELWWQNHGVEEREALKRVIASGQFEILTGGWVMADDANTHYFALVMQLLEGHEWARNHLGANITIASHWGLDSFGLSSTIPYLLAEAGIKQGVEMRVHYAVRSVLAARRELEFYWRQAWRNSDDGAGDFLTHILPLDGFHVSESCGTQPQVCCQFDFHHINEPCLGNWGGSVVGIDEANVAERATLLADQFRKKSQLYRSNSIFVPWGEDERYRSEEEWANQHDHLRLLFDYINSHPADFNMRVQFGTLSQYFAAVRHQTIHPLQSSQDASEKCGHEDVHSHKSASSRSCIPSLSGDFFVYAEREDEYWSGYFTTHAFFKHLDRWLQHYLRTADLLYTVAINNHPVDIGGKKGRKGKKLVGGGRDEELDAGMKELLSLYPRLVAARRSLSLFQHHDAITGTWMDRVMEDFGMRLLAGIRNCMTIITRSSHHLLLLVAAADEQQQKKKELEKGEKIPAAGNLPALTIDLEFSTAEGKMELPRQSVIEAGSELLLFNPLAFEREKEVVCLLVPLDVEAECGGDAGEVVEGDDGGGEKSRRRNRTLVVYEEGGSEGKKIGWVPIERQQLQPEIVVRDGRLTLAEDKQKLCFHTIFPALGFRRFYLDYFSFSSEAVVEKMNKGDNGKIEDRHQLLLRYPLRAKLLLKGEIDDAASVASKCFPSAPPKDGDLTFDNGQIAVSIDSHTGFLQRLTPLESEQKLDEEETFFGGWASAKQMENKPPKPINIQLSFEVYRSRPSEISSGLFFFIPAGPAKPMPIAEEGNSYVLIDGPVQKALMVKINSGSGDDGGAENKEQPYHLVHSLELDTQSAAVTIRNWIDLSPNKDVEVSMRLRSEQELSDFYTELNAFQFIKRQRLLDKLPIQAHVFPMPGAAFIEGQHQRFTLLGRQALGVASLEPGWLEVLLDRHVTGDDRHAEKNFVKRLTESRFQILLEDYSLDRSSVGWNNSNVSVGYHSEKSFRTSLQVQYPIVVQFRQISKVENEEPSKTLAAVGDSPIERSLLRIVGEPLPSDMHLVALRTLSHPTDYVPKAQPALVEFLSQTTLPKSAAALILHRVGVECRLPHHHHSRGSGRGPELCSNNDAGDEEGNVGGGGTVSVKSIFGRTLAPQPQRVAEASLTLMSVAKELGEENGDGEDGLGLGRAGNVRVLKLKPMEIKSWLVEF